MGRAGRENFRRVYGNSEKGARAKAGRSLRIRGADEGRSVGDGRIQQPHSQMAKDRQNAENPLYCRAGVLYRARRVLGLPDRAGWKDQYDHLTTAMTEQIRNGQYARAQETYQKAKEVSSSKGYVDLLRSDMLIAQGKYEENEQYLADTVLQMDDITKNSNYLAQALKNPAESQFALGEYEPAAQNYASAYELQEDDAALARDYAITLAYLGNFDQANTVLEQAQAGGLTSGDLVLAQSEIQHAMGNTAQAIEQLEALKMETADPAMQYQIYCRLPDWKMEVGEYEKSSRPFRRSDRKTARGVWIKNASAAGSRLFAPGFKFARQEVSPEGGGSSSGNCESELCLVSGSEQSGRSKPETRPL